MSVVIWYFLLFVIGLASYPWATRLFHTFEDKGYAFSKTLGLVLLGFGHWYLVTFGLNQNNRFGVYASLAVLVIFGIAGWLMNTTVLNDLIRNWKKILISELVFLFAFGFMATVRSLNPEINGTEKPMELAFINAIIKSPVFPPSDPWMSGYSISYYYFGYLLTAILSSLGGITGSIGFNLMIATVFGLGALNSYSILLRFLNIDLFPFNLKSELKRHLAALLAPLFILVVSNAEGFLELIHALGIGWTDGGKFWHWLNIKELAEVPIQQPGWNPRFWFWWRASRVISDYDLVGNHIEVIDEFPFFSFLLGDLHPHVLAIPIVLFLVGMAAEFFIRGRKALENNPTRFLVDHKVFLAVYGFGLGILGFTNTWDLPIYFGLMAVLIIYFLFRAGLLIFNNLFELARTLMGIFLMAIIPFLPFYVAFSSQAGGILPNIAFPSSSLQLWVMFAPLFVPVFLFLVMITIQQKTSWIRGLLSGFFLVLGLFIISIALGALIHYTQPAGSLNLFGAVDFNSLIKMSTIRRVQEAGGLIILVLLFGLALGILIRRSKVQSTPDDFFAILILLGIMLIIAPEFIYLRDQFGTRMNTIFKFYYQAWILLAISTAYAVVRIRYGLTGFLRAGALLVILATTVVGLAYPILALPQKLEITKPGKMDEITLEGAAHIERYQPEVFASMNWLYNQKPAVIAEAVGGSYTEYSRMSTFSGQSSVLGWPGHESQWRGSYDLIPGRLADIKTLYETDQWELAKMVIDAYDITYIVVSDLERSAYQVQTEKFDEFLPVVWEIGSVRIYQVKEN